MTDRELEREAWSHDRKVAHKDCPKLGGHYYSLVPGFLACSQCGKRLPLRWLAFAKPVVRNATLKSIREKVSVAEAARVAERLDVMRERGRGKKNAR